MNENPPPRSWRLPRALEGASNAAKNAPATSDGLKPPQTPELRLASRDISSLPAGTDARPPLGGFSSRPSGRWDTASGSQGGDGSGSALPRVAAPASTKVATSTANTLDPQCRAIVLKFQIGKEPSDAERNLLRHGCRTSMVERHRNQRIGSLIVVLAVMLAACSHPTPPQQSGPTSAAAPLPSLKDGVPVLATALVTIAVLPPPPPSGRYPVVIDPWIDVTTGSQVATTKLMQEELETLAPQHFPQLESLPFTPENLARKPVVLLGAIAPVAGSGAVEPVSGRPGAYRVYGMLADLGTGKIASAKDAWVRPEGIDPDSSAIIIGTVQSGSRTRASSPICRPCKPSRVTRSIRPICKICRQRR